MMTLFRPYPDSFPAGLSLAKDEFHLWCAALDPPLSKVAEMGRTLAQVERERAARFYFDRDRNSFIVSRGLLRTLLGGYSREDPRQLQFTYGDQGKPKLR